MTESEMAKQRKQIFILPSSLQKIAFTEKLKKKKCQHEKCRAQDR